MGVWAITAGLVESSAAFRSGEPAGTPAMLILGGLVENSVTGSGLDSHAAAGTR